MMGPYYYYDTSYIEDIPAELHIHDCMWSGECYSCQPARVTFSSASVAPATNGTVPITVGGTGYITLTATQQESPKKLTWPPERPSVAPKLEMDRSPEVSLGSSPDSTPESSPRQLPEKSTRISAKKTTSIKVAGFSSTDNKKLRHREVEKNRHRQLQAMVKTLSGKIPGRLDKETQVQTMKRAARYCVYLRDVLNSLPHGQQPMMLKEKLEKLYLRSCDNVELVMSQNMSAR